MTNRGTYMWAALVILITKSHHFGMISAFERDLNLAGQTSNETGILRNPSLQNGSSESYGTVAPNSSSQTGENLTSNVKKCLQMERQFRVSPEPIAPVCMDICLGVWSVITNSLPLAAIIKYEQLHIPAYILMANLAASDVLAGLTFIWMGSSRLFFILTETDPSKAILRLRLSLISLSGFSSAYGLMALTAERYWFIVHGMTYVNNVTNDKCKVVILIVWGLSLVLGMLPNFDWNCDGPFDEAHIPFGAGLSYNYVVAFLVFFSIPVAAIVLFNMGILWCLWKHVSNIAAQEASVGARPSTSRRSAITIVLMTAVFLVGWLPLIVTMALFTNDLHSAVHCVFFVMMNSCANPIIYAFRLREVRRRVARLFGVNRTGIDNSPVTVRTRPFQTRVCPLTGLKTNRAELKTPQFNPN